MKTIEIKRMVILLAVTLLLIPLTGCLVSKTSYDSLQNDYADLQEEHVSLQEDYGLLQTDYENLLEFSISSHRFEKQIVKGLEEYYEGGLNRGAAEAYYDEASESYKTDDFWWASYYADFADTYYAYASQDYRDAKAFFTEAAEVALDGSKAKELAGLFVELMEISAQVSSEMHEASEYFASACTYYDNGDYSMGGLEIDKMNKHIKAHDDLIPKQNDLLSQINVLLDNWAEEELGSRLSEKK